MGKVDRDLEEMERILNSIKEKYVQVLIDYANLLYKCGQLSTTSLSGTTFATKQEEIVMSSSQEIIRILTGYDDYLEKELIKIRRQIADYQQLENGYSR